jgi:hypothetical protein
MTGSPLKWFFSISLIAWTIVASGSIEITRLVMISDAFITLSLDRS